MIRLATASETHTILGAFESIEEGLSHELWADVEFLLKEEEHYQVVLAASPDLADLPAELIVDADHAGLRIGTLHKDGNFALDLQGAIDIPQFTRSQCIKVNDLAAKSFLYGKHVLGQSIHNFDPRLNPGATCIVVNARWETLGLGTVVGRFKGPNPAIEPIIDLGIYLREEGE